MEPTSRNSFLIESSTSMPITSPVFGSTVAATSVFQSLGLPVTTSDFQMLSPRMCGMSLLAHSSAWLCMRNAFWNSRSCSRIGKTQLTTTIRIGRVMIAGSAASASFLPRIPGCGIGLFAFCAGL